MPRTKSLPQYAFKPTPPGYPLLEVQRIQHGHVLHRMPPHSHHYLEFLYFERPGGRHRVGTYTEAVEAGSLFVIAPGEIHDARAMGNAEGWVVMFTPDALEPEDSRLSGFFQWLSHPLFLPFLRPLGINNSSFRTQLSDRARWTTHLFALERELSEAGFAFREAAGALLRLMLVDLARQVDPRLREALPHRTAFLERVFAFIDAQYAQSLRMTDLAAHVHRSPNHITAVVKEATGRSVREWVRERRMAEARVLLMRGGDVAGVGEQVGYPDVTHFIRQFKRGHGLTPLAWRNAQQELP